MTENIMAWITTGLMITTVVAFVVYLFAVARLPDERPRVSTYDRYGRPLGRYENPGERIAPGREGDPLERRKEPSEE